MGSIVETCPGNIQVVREPILGTLGWPFQAPQTAYGKGIMDAKSDALIPLYPIPSSKDVHDYLQLYCSNDLHLVVSPYTSPPHLLNLKTVDIPQQLMAKALTVMASLRHDFAVAPYDEAFNWPTVINALRGLVQAEGFSWQRQEFYIIVFRSTLAPTTNYLRLGDMDEVAHAEATKSGGLLKYWFGEPDLHGRNLATCMIALAVPILLTHQLTVLGVWRKQEDTKGGSQGHGHQTAMRATRNVFSKWEVERKKFVVDQNVEQWWFEDWKM